MRDSYAADVGDFGKYALRNALPGSDLRHFRTCGKGNDYCVDIAHE